MAFDDRKTEPLIAVGCLSILCGLVAPAVGRFFGWWWGLLLFVPPGVLWVLLEWVWRREDRRR
jgi:hypothetical protein